MTPHSEDEPVRREGQCEPPIPAEPPATPKTALNHQKVNQKVMPGWLKFALLVIGILGFIVVMILVR